MPEMNGWQCLAKLKNSSQFRDIPVVMYTTSSNPRDREIAQDLQAHGFITKPSNPKLLEQILHLVVCNPEKDELRNSLNQGYLLSQDR
jgi:CheY-like chemotaxis protein